MGLPSIERNKASISFFASAAVVGVDVVVADLAEASDKILLFARFSLVNGAVVVVEEEVVAVVAVEEGGATMGIALDSLLKVLRGGEGIGTATGERNEDPP